VFELHCETEKHKNFDHKELRTGTHSSLQYELLKLHAAKKEILELQKVTFNLGLLIYLLLLKLRPFVSVATSRAIRKIAMEISLDSLAFCISGIQLKK